MQFKLDEYDNSSLEYLVPDWINLCNKCKKIAPFQFPQWLVPWWNIFGVGKLIVLTVKNGDHLVGIAPFFLFNDNQKNKLCFIGTGITDYIDVIVLPGYENQVAKSILSYIADIRSQWDECDFQDIPDYSILLKCNYPDVFKIKKSEWNICTYLDLPDNLWSFKTAISRKLRKNLSHAARILNNNGGYQIIIADSNNFGSYLHHLFRLHRARWNTKNQNGVLDSEKLINFHHQVSNGLIGDDHVRLYVMLHEENAIAAYYTLVNNNTVYAYIGGFDPQRSEYSPGSLLLFHIIEDSLKRGVDCIDFLRGYEPYKNHWRPLFRVNSRIQILKEDSR